MRQAICFAALCLLAGAALNIVVALGCTVAAQKRPGVILAPTQADQELLIRRYELPAFSTLTDGRLKAVGYRELKVWAFNPKVYPRVTEELTISEVEAGWPFRCLRRTSIEPSSTPPQNQFSGAKRSVLSVSGGKLLIPKKPIWPAFAYNSLIYAGLIGIVPFLWTVRRFLRRRRGQCQACGYPIGQNPLCTECGVEIDRPA